MPDAAVATTIVPRFAAGEIRALSRAISLVERRNPAVPELLKAIAAETKAGPPTLGVTGAPGAGKSTIAAALIRAARVNGRTVGVLAVDPSSPFSGGALLGDRLRMDEHLLDPGVFVRSMSARGQLGGLSPAASEVVWLLSAFGFDEVIVETVGAGQSELEIRHLVDTTAVVLTPGAGDEIQVDKAGIMEIADVFVVNKADLPGADQLVRELRTMINLGSKRDWRPRIVSTIATGLGEGIENVWEVVGAHRAHLASQPDPTDAAAERARRAAAALVGERARAWALDQLRHDFPHDAELRRGLSVTVADALSADLGLAPPGGDD